MKAEALLRDLQQYWIEINDTINQQYALILYDLCELHDRTGAYDQAVSECKSALQINEKVSVKKSENYIRNLNLTGYVLDSKGSHEEAEHYFLNAKKHFDFVEENSLHTEILLNLGYNAEQLNKIEKAENYYFEALEISIKLNDKANQWTSLNNLGVLYMGLKDYIKSRDFQYQALALKKDEPNSKDYAIGLNNLATCYYHEGRYEECQKILLESLTIKEKSHDTKTLSYANGLSNLAALYVSTGRFSEAAKLFLETEEIERSILPKDHATHLNTLQNQAVLDMRLGNYPKAKIIFEKVAEIHLGKSGKDNFQYGFALEQLGIISLYKEDFNAAEKLLGTAVEIFKNKLGQYNERYYSAVQLLAYATLKSTGKDISGEVFSETKLIRDSIYTPEIIDYYKWVRTYSKVLYHQKNYKRQNEILKEAIESFPKNQIRTSLELIDIQNYLFNSYMHLQQYDDDIALSTDMHKIIKQDIDNTFSYLSDEEKQIFIDKHGVPLFERCFSLAHNFSNEINNDFQYDLALLNKGLQLQASKSTLEFIFETQDSVSLEHYYQLLGARRNLSRLYKKPDEHTDEIAKLESQKAKFEGVLARASAEFREIKQLTSVTHNEVKKQLASDEAAIEFIHFNYSDPDPTDSILYAALVLLPNEKHVHYVPLFSEQEFEKLISEKSSRDEIVTQFYSSRGLKPRKNKTTSNELHDLVWSKLGDYLDNVKTIYFSPSGQLNRINFGALPISNKRTLANRYDLIQLSSTRSLVLNADLETNQLKTAFIAGGINYNEVSPDRNLIALNDQSIPIYTSYDKIRTMIDGKWNYLPGTLKEANSVHSLLLNKTYTSDLWTSEDATEIRFKEMGMQRQSPKIIHIATHGFFAPKTEQDKKDNAMHRSGLLFAGVNKTSDYNQEDGILTAYEVANLNLTNTELVVLSACETGLGEIQGSEGVFGLQRAFKIAGARYILMSLWQVPDEETSIFMTTFYKILLKKNKTIPEAFAATQKKMRKKFKDPYLWAGFILVE